MRILWVIVVLTMASVGYATEMNDQQMGKPHMQSKGSVHSPLALKDGSYVFISEKGTMRMVDENGKQMKMKENAEMEMMDGSLLMMKNLKLWRHVHRDTK